MRKRKFRGRSRDLKEYLRGNYIKKEIAEHVTKCLIYRKDELRTTGIYIEHRS